jgi:hypothetical protein
VELSWSIGALVEPLRRKMLIGNWSWVNSLINGQVNACVTRVNTRFNTDQSHSYRIENRDSTRRSTKAVYHGMSELPNWQYLTGSNRKPMPRSSKESKRPKKSSKLQLESLYRKCRYCNTHRRTNRFDKHQKACKTQWEILHERRNQKTEASRTQATQEAMNILVEPKASMGYHSGPGSVERSSAIPVDSLDSDMNIVDDFPCLSPAPSPCANAVAATKQTGEY